MYPETRKIRAIIVDDEELCISNLKYYLNEFCPEISIIATGCTIDEAQAIIESTNFEIAFFDVELYGNNIFTIFPQLTDKKFYPVFVTAYEQYALPAIKNEALDYLLKPLSPKSILECYERIKRRLYGGDDFLKENTFESEQTAGVEKAIILRQGDKMFVILPSDILYWQGKRAYTIVHFIYDNEPKSVIISKTINLIKNENYPSTFFRVHKSYIVNVKWIIGVVKNNGMFVKMQNGETIPVAKRRVHDFVSFYKAAKDQL